jgi:hypothetical protein
MNRLNVIVLVLCAAVLLGLAISGVFTCISTGNLGTLPVAIVILMASGAFLYLAHLLHRVA